MDCDALRDDQWERIRSFVSGGTRGKRGPRTNNRLFLDALLWMARSGGRWRDLPERLGDYRSVIRVATAKHIANMAINHGRRISRILTENAGSGWP
jgi:transposase